MSLIVKVSEFLPRIEQLSKLTKRSKEDKSQGKVSLSVIENGLRIDAVGNYVSMMLVSPVLESGHPGEVGVVDVKSLLEILRKVKKEDLSIVFDGDKIVLSSGRSRFKLTCFDANSVTVLTHTSSGNICTSISSAKLYTLLERVSYASADDDEVSLAYMAGVYLHTDGGKLISVAVNGHRLARHAFQCDSLNIPDGLMIPNQGVERILKFLDTPDHQVEVSIGNGKLSLTDDSGKIVVRLLENNFPDYRGMIPEMVNSIELDTISLLAALDRAKYLVDGTEKVSLSEDNRELVLDVNSYNGSSTEVVSVIENNVAPIPKIGVNRSYLHDALKCEVVVDFKDGLSPILMHGLVDKEYKAIIMPMRN